MASMVSAMADWGAYEGWHGERKVRTAQEARALCGEIEAHEPPSRMLVGFTTALGQFFAVGLGAPDSCAMFWEPADPPYSQSKGPHPTEERTAFSYGGQHTELPGTVRITRELAFTALDECIETGRRPECIEWEET